MKKDIFWSVDSIQNDIARLEGPDREIKKVSVSSLPIGVKEGDCLREESGELCKDECETTRRRQENIRLFEKLSKKRGL